jgi:hypothetical protein
VVIDVPVPAEARFEVAAEPWRVHQQ